MNAHCPNCNHLFPRADRGRLLGGLWTPRVATCPSCETSIQWSPTLWRLQLIGALCLIPAMIRALPGSLRLTALALSITLVFSAILTLKLRLTPSETRRPLSDETE